MITQLLLLYNTKKLTIGTTNILQIHEVFALFLQFTLKCSQEMVLCWLSFFRLSSPCLPLSTKAHGASYKLPVLPGDDCKMPVGCCKRCPSLLSCCAPVVQVASCHPEPFGGCLPPSLGNRLPVSIHRKLCPNMAHAPLGLSDGRV